MTYLSVVSCLLLGFSLPGWADFSYEQTSRITGGAMMRMGGPMAGKTPPATNSTVAIKGNKMVNTSAHGGTIIDLDARTVTTLNFDHKTFSVMGFDEFKSAADNAGKGKTPSLSDFKVAMKDGANTRTVLGQPTHEKIVTVSLALADPRTGSKTDAEVQNDMYVAKGIEGVKELRDFNKRMSEVGYTPGAMPGMGRPEMAKAFAEMAKNSEKLDGLPLLTIMRINGVMPGMPAAAAGANAGPIMEMTVEVTKYSAKSVEASLFAIPAGFTKADPASRRGPQ